MKCMDCGEARARHEDPRSPPLDEGKCLCSDCYIGAAEGVLEELQGQISDIRAKMYRLERRRRQVAMKGSKHG